MTKDKTEKKAAAPTDMNAAPAPSKKAAGKAVTTAAPASGEVKAKAKKPAKDPVKAVADHKAEAVVAKEVEPPAVSEVVEAPVAAPKARRLVLTAS
jgi:hypothetical protein